MKALLVESDQNQKEHSTDLRSLGPTLLTDDEMQALKQDMMQAADFADTMLSGDSK